MLKPVIALALAAVAFTASPARAADAHTLLKTWDPDKDGTLDLPELKRAALARFEQLDVDHDGTLDTKELSKVGISKAELKKADPDDDATLDKDEYVAIVEARFKRADPDNDGTLDAAELKTKAGKAVAKLL